MIKLLLLIGMAVSCGKEQTKTKIEPEIVSDDLDHRGPPKKPDPVKPPPPTPPEPKPPEPEGPIVDSRPDDLVYFAKADFKMSNNYRYTFDNSDYCTAIYAFIDEWHRYNDLEYQIGPDGCDTYKRESDDMDIYLVSFKNKLGFVDVFLSGNHRGSVECTGKIHEGFQDIMCREDDPWTFKVSYKAWVRYLKVEPYTD